MRDPRFVKATAWHQHNQATREELEDAGARGRSVAEGPAVVAHLAQAQEALDAHRAGVRWGFDDAFVAAARAAPERLNAWANALQEALEQEIQNLGAAAAAEHEDRALRGAMELWRGEGDPFSVWTRLPEVPLIHDGVRQWAQILIRVHPERGLRALDTLPYPSLMSEILHRGFQEDRDAIDELIPAAPLVVDAHGAWVPERSVAALLVMDLVTTHARALHDAISYARRAHADPGSVAEAETDLRIVETQVLPPWMTRAFGLFLQRRDGQQIVLAYLCHLSRAQLLGRGPSHDGRDHWTAHTAALAALIKALQGASIGIAQVRGAWESAEKRAVEREAEDALRNRVRRRSSGKLSDREDEGARTLHGEGLPYLFGAALLLGDASTPGTKLDPLWSWFEELLVGRDPGLSLIHHGTSLSDVPQRIGYLLSRLPDPGSRLQAAYKKLEPQRRRALFSLRYDEIYPDLESVILLRVGLNAAANWCDRLRKAGEPADAVPLLFFWIYEQARRLWLTAVLDTGDAKKQLVKACFAFVPFLFGEGIGAALKQLIPAIANDAHMLADACAMLTMNSVAPTKVRELIAETGADLEAALHELRAWSELTGRKEDFPDHLQKLAGELGILDRTPTST